jgi:hypothetical protein
MSGKLTGEKKERFLRRMAAGKRRAKNPANPKRRRRARRKNEGEIAKATKQVQPLLLKAGGLGIGVLVGSRLTEFADEKMIQKIENKHLQALSLLALGMGVLYLGNRYGRGIADANLKSLSLAATMGGAAPFVLAAMALEGIGGDVTPAPEPPPPDNQDEAAEGWQYKRRLDPRYVAGMSGTLIGGRSPAQATMRGTLIDASPGQAVMRGSPVIPRGSIFERSNNGSLLS